MRHHPSSRPLSLALPALIGLALWLSAGPALARCDTALRSRLAVRSLIQAINARDLPGVLSRLSDDVVYKNTGVPTLRGKAQVETFLGPFFQLLSAIDFQVLDALAEPGTVATRRLDVVDVVPLGGNPAQHLEIPVMGYFHVSPECKITLWADYFDTLSWDTGTGLPLPKQFPPDNTD